MKVYNIFFYSALFFIFGIAIANLGLNLFIIVLLSLLFAAIIFLFGYFKNSRKFLWIAGLSLFIILGASYSFWREDNAIKNFSITLDRKINFQGIIIDDPSRGDSQKFTIELQPPYSGKILIKLRPHPSFHYNNLVDFNGVVKNPEPAGYKNYLAKDEIFGVSDFPLAEKDKALAPTNALSTIKSSLFGLREKISSHIERVLSLEKSAFLSGLILGDRGEIPKALKTAMSQSGTSHLVALSGYNISIIVVVISAIFASFLSRKTSFILTTIAVIGFVLMTGAQTSVVRAAIMSFIILLASEVGRVYDVRNSIAFAGLIMVLVNPKVLNFDVGFQLSFGALIGIVYIKPALEKLFGAKEESFLNWQSSLFTTASAQLAVAPILIASFGRFSLFSLLANLLVLEVIPITMFLGFMIGILGFVSGFLATLLGWFGNIFLSYELGIINFFSRIPLAITMNIGFAGAIIYYLFITWFLIKSRKNVESQPSHSNF